jgi:hypothetical protein
MASRGNTQLSSQSPKVSETARRHHMDELVLVSIIRYGFGMGGTERHDLSAEAARGTP